MYYKILFTKLLAVIVVATFLIGNQIIAQKKSFGVQGVTEISGNISYSSLTPVSNGKSSDAISIFAFTPQVGYFIQDGLEIGLSTGLTFLPGVTVISPSSGDNVTLLGLYFSPSYNFITKNESLFPFLEAQLGYTAVSSGSTTNSGFSYGGKCGLKIPVVDNLLLNISAQFVAITLNPKSASKRSGINYLTFGVGIGGYF